MLLCSLLIIVLIPLNSLALQYRYEGWDYEFDDTNYWVDGWCYRPHDEVEKTAILVAYDPNIIKGEELIIPEIINGYRVNGFAHGLFRWSTFKKCDLSKFPNLSNRMFEESSLENVILSKDTKKIPDGCFLDCPIKEIELPEGIEIIEAYAFRGTKLKELVIPSTVKELEFQVVSYCPELKKIEFKNGMLAGFDEYSLSLGATFMVENLETLIIPENITQIGENEFKVAEAGRHGFNFIKYPDNLTIYGKQGSYAEEYAAEHELSFVAIESENSIFEDEKVNFESKYDISQYMDSSIYKIYDVFDTDYGAVVYYSMGGFMRAPGPGLSLVRENGDVVNLSLGVSKKDLYRRPVHNDITLSEDGKYVTFNVSFDERAEGSEGMLGGNLVVFHDAGTYYYKADLETGVCIETRFEPLDTMGEDMISAWAKPEVENAIKLGFVPIALRENYKRNITRAEFAKMAMDFLSFSYGYSNATQIKTWSEVDYEKYGYVDNEFLDAYCHAKPDRNGDPFMSGDKEYKYDSNIQITMAKPFENTEDFLYYDSVIAAYNIGIVNGVSETEFNPNGDITRQEAAAMLMRVYKNYGAVEEETNDYLFADNDSIADWAKDDVYQINKLGVMQGVGNDMFAPLNNYTIEQAIATFLRLYENAPVSRKNKNIVPLLEMKFEKEKVTEGNSGGRGWVTLEEKEFVFDDYTILQGVWNMRHYGGSDVIYIFHKSGGVSSFYTDGNLTSEVEIDADRNIIRYNAKVSDTFRLYNQLCGSEKVYSAGEYMFECDIETGNILRLERIA